MSSPRTPPIPKDEVQRLASLRALDLLDTEAEERFDRITRLVQRVLGVPMATLTLVDEERQWFKSRQGIEDEETPRSESFCAHGLTHPGVFVVPDATQDPRFAENPSVTGDPNIRFYAGSPIRSPDGEQIGALCAIDSAPRELSPEDEQTLNDLAQMVQQEIAALTLAITDGLTGLSNRSGFVALSSQVLKVAVRVGVPVALLYLDVDGLKDVNDTHGHNTGDQLLTDMASLLESTLRDSDVIARLGGDEFAVVLTGSPTEGVGDAAGRLRAATEEHNRTAGRPYAIEFSIGRVDLAEDSRPDLDAMLSEADALMYEEKRAKRA